MGTTANYRYPGINYFTKKDKAIFCGRQEDTNTLYTQVMLSRTLVLHADSGAGKSSLIQAGFLPLLDERQNESFKLDTNLVKYFPITIRFDFLKKTTENENKQSTINKEALIEDTLAKIKLEFPQLNTIHLPYTDAINTDSLWCIGKKMATEKLKPLLIFDQFEELQAYPIETITHFKKELAEFLGSEMPKSIYDAIKQTATEMSSRGNTTDDEKKKLNDNIAFFEKPLDAKVIFVLREDRLGTMSLLSDYFPNILKNDFLLNPLSFENACVALTEPAMAIGDFESPQFIFESKELVTKLVTEIADNQTRLVDPIQIQIVATKIERNCMTKAALHPNTDGKPYVVTQEDIPNLSDIINEFYNNCWTTLKDKLELSDAEFESKRNKITSTLVINDRRDLVNSGWIIDNQTSNIDQKIVDELLATGLLRVVPYGKVKYYQLCHDRFIKPVVEDQQKYELIKKDKETEKLKKDLESERKRADKMKELYRKIKIKNKITIAVVCIFLIISYYYSKTILDAKAELIILKKKEVTISKSLALDYIAKADNLIEEKRYPIAKSYLLEAKKFLTVYKNDSLNKSINSKLREIENQKK
ncbi:hypothetical protein [Flavobacterium sp.]|uniref:nSTAND1 domain-containing NTPase n=1 Tax=Flavobacterium sp. TaxID=239 RepID=UPI00286D4819|nr:hypothetical protein [Flavobacterium sp.]